MLLSASGCLQSSPPGPSAEDGPRVRFLNDGAWPDREITFLASDPPSALLQTAPCSSLLPAEASPTAWLPRWKRMRALCPPLPDTAARPAAILVVDPEAREAASAEVDWRASPTVHASAPLSLPTLPSIATDTRQTVHDWIAVLGLGGREGTRCAPAPLLPEEGCHARAECGEEVDGDGQAQKGHVTGRHGQISPRRSRSPESTWMGKESITVKTYVDKLKSLARRTRALRPASINTKPRTNGLPGCRH